MLCASCGHGWTGTSRQQAAACLCSRSSAFPAAAAASSLVKHQDVIQHLCSSAEATLVAAVIGRQQRPRRESMSDAAAATTALTTAWHTAAAAKAVPDALTAAWQAAAAAKDVPDGRQAFIRDLLSGLLALAATPDQLSTFLANQLSTYANQQLTRSRLDAVLQAFLALAPETATAPFLSAWLLLPPERTLQLPLRRDITALFRAPAPALAAAWPQQGIACCCIVANLSWRALGAPVSSVQQAAAAVSLLTDCLLQAEPQRQLVLAQLVLAQAVHETGKQHHVQPPGPDTCVSDEQRPAKKPRLMEDQQMQQQQQQQQQEQQQLQPDAQAPRDGSSAQLPALAAALQLLAAICCCEFAQHGSKLLLPTVAMAAASALAAAPACALTAGQVPVATWLLRQLAHQFAPAAANAAAAPAAVSFPGASKQAAAAAAASQAAMMQPPAALQHLLLQLAEAGPQHVLSFVTMLTDAPASEHAAASAFPAECSTQSFQGWILQLAGHWQQVPAAAPGSTLTPARAGKPAGKAAQQWQGAAASAAQQHLRDWVSQAPCVPVTWVCTHVVPVLAQQAAAAGTQQQRESQQPGVGTGVPGVCQRVLQELSLPAEAEQLEPAEGPPGAGSGRGGRTTSSP